jgi:iron(III) transport system permease protein
MTGIRATAVNIAVRLRSRRAALMLAVLILLVGVLVLSPIGIILFKTFRAADGGLGLDAWARAFAEPGIVRSIINTISVVIATQLISIPISIVIAWLLARTDLPWRRGLEFGFWIAFLIPVLGTTTGWILLLDPVFGLLNQALRFIGIGGSDGLFNIYSYWGIVFTHLVTLSISVKVILLTPGFRNLDASLEEASRMSGAGTFATLTRIVLPVLTPVLIVVSLMALIRALEAFEIELILGRPIDFSVYSTKMYMLLRSSPPDVPSATVLATVILMLLMPLALLERWMSTRRSYTTVTGKQNLSLHKLRRWRWPAFLLVAGAVLMMTVIPVIFQVVGSLMTLFGFFDIDNVWTFQHWRRALGQPAFGRTLSNSLLIGLGTVAFALLVFSMLGYVIARSRYRAGALLDFLAWLPFTIPGVILGLGILQFVLNVPLMRPIFGSIWVMIFAAGLTSITLSVQLFKTGFLQISPEMEEASRVAGASWISTFRVVDMPLILPTTAVVAMMVFASAIRQVGALVFLFTGKTQPLSILQLELLFDSELGAAAVVGTIVVLIGVSAAIVARFFESRFSLDTT